MFLVEKCFHWVGFHIVEYLLGRGYTVSGNDKINTDAKDHLSMLIGRNANFTHLEQRPDSKVFDIRITPDEDKLTLHKESTSTMKLPLLFGEWMPMNQEGMYHRNEFIAFDSDRFLIDAVYIGDFLTIVQQCIDASNLPSVIKVKHGEKDAASDLKLENSVFIRNNRPIMNRLKTVQNHYEKFSEFYQCH